MDKQLKQVLSLPYVWQASHSQRTDRTIITSHFSELDRVLGGWSLGATTELLTNEYSAGMLELLMPALTSRLEQKDWVILIAPPFMPFAPAWKAAGVDPSRLLIVHPRTHREKLWSAETALRSGNSAAVLCWQGQTRLQTQDLRRLQIAAAEQQTLNMLWRPPHEQQQSSPSAVRIAATSTPDGLELEVIKQRGRQSGQLIHIDPLNKKRPEPRQPLATYVHLAPLPKRQSRLSAIPANGDTLASIRSLNEMSSRRQTTPHSRG